MDKFSNSKGMRRFFISPEELNQSEITLKDEEFHHLKSVCRLEEGERVEVLDARAIWGWRKSPRLTKNQHG